MVSPTHPIKCLYCVRSASFSITFYCQFGTVPNIEIEIERQSQCAGINPGVAQTFLSIRFKVARLGWNLNKRTKILNPRFFKFNVCAKVDGTHIGLLIHEEAIS
jgi:hypothetical protein